MATQFEIDCAIMAGRTYQTIIGTNTTDRTRWRTDAAANGGKAANGDTANTWRIAA